MSANSGTSKELSIAPIKILKCSCRSEFQDRKYGKGMRVHNPAKDGALIKYNCTVCGPGPRKEIRLKLYAAKWTPLFG